MKPDWIYGIEYAVAFVSSATDGQSSSTVPNIHNSNRYEGNTAPSGSTHGRIERQNERPNEAYHTQELKREYDAKLQITRENEALREQNKTLGKECEHQRKECEQQRKECEQKRKECEQLRKEREQQSKECEQLRKELEQQRKECEQLRKKNKDLENRSMSLTRVMSKLTDSKGNFEDVNEEVNNTKLAQRFECLYSQKWVLLIMWMLKNCQAMPEVDRISHITNLMKSANQECKTLADEKLCVLLHVNSLQDNPINEALADAKKIMFKKYVFGDYVKQRIVQEISDKLMQTEDVGTLCSGDNTSTAREKLKTFLDEYIECCLLLAVSNPAMVLDFDVVGKMFSDCDDHFKMYSTKRPVEDMTKIEGTICEVVWPCVQLEEGPAIYMKGDVVVVKRGKQA